MIWDLLLLGTFIALCFYGAGLMIAMRSYHLICMAPPLPPILEREPDPKEEGDWI